MPRNEEIHDDLGEAPPEAAEGRQEEVEGLRVARRVEPGADSEIPMDVRDSWTAPEKTWNRPLGGGDTFSEVPEENPDPVYGRQRQRNRPEREYPTESGERPPDA
jgi:hypothetical protein